MSWFEIHHRCRGLRYTSNVENGINTQSILDSGLYIDQYVFLNEALADALCFGTHCIWSRDYLEIYDNMMQIDPDTTEQRLQTQCNFVEESIEDRKKLEIVNHDTNDQVYTKVFVHNIKSETVITFDEYMPKSKSMVQVKEPGAVLLPNYEGKNVFIVTKVTHEGVWSLIAEQNIKTVVAIQGSSSDHDKTDGPVNVSQFAYKSWDNNTTVPKDFKSMIYFLEVVLNREKRLTSTQPVLIHCGDDFERSGLVCVLLAELERMKRDEGHINIIQSVKMMKERNETIIPNFEQYKYIYDAIHSTFYKDDVYANC